jgi:fructose-bisphosphate aldolase class I
MSGQDLVAIAKAMVAAGKGILAADESYGTANKRFEKIGIPATEEMRRAYREMLFTAPGIGEFFSGVILFDETMHQSTQDGKPFPQLLTEAGMIPGIKLDTGAKPLANAPGESVTEGLDGLRDRIAEYYKLGARFAKWRAVITIGNGIPSQRSLEANAHGLARYAALCQEGGLVPIVEPEVMMDGDHMLERCFEVTVATHQLVFDQLYRAGVELDKMVLKPNMVIPGEDCPTQSSVDEVATATVNCLLRTTPAAVPGIAFLSGGQSDEVATAHLNAMNTLFKDKLPWTLTFSYGRALQQPSLTTWKGEDANVAQAQKELHKRAKYNALAALGEYKSDLESIAA